MSSRSRHKILQDKAVATLYPVTYRLLTHLAETGYSPQRKALAIEVFGEIVFQASQDPATLIDLAERVDSAMRQARNLGKR
jgi:hypothetical protein